MGWDAALAKVARARTVETVVVNFILVVRDLGKNKCDEGEYADAMLCRWRGGCC